MHGANQTRPRLRDLGITIGTRPPGPLNAVTDVAGVRVGHTTLIEGEGPLRRGAGPVRTGVTAILPHDGNLFEQRVMCATQVLNGAGEMTGRAQIDEWGVLESPILLTNTHSVGAVYDAAVAYMVDHDPRIGPDDFVIPVVAECWDGLLNDTAGDHVRREHVYAALDAALDAAQGGPVVEGAVGAGTGMACFEFKGGIGTASRLVEIDGATYTVGLLVLCNFGSRPFLTVDGVPVGRYITDLMPDRGAPAEAEPEGSIILVAATDAPLLDRQLARICRRCILGLARTGSIAGDGSGDLLIAFSTAARIPRTARRHETAWLADPELNPLFAGTVEATEEAILNALCAATTTSGRDGNVLHALPIDRLVEIMRAHGRLGRA